MKQTNSLLIILIVIIGLLMFAAMKLMVSVISVKEITETTFEPYEIGLITGGEQSFGKINANAKFAITKQDSVKILETFGFKTAPWGYKSRGVEISGPVLISFGIKADSNFVSVFDEESIGKKIIKGDSTFYTIITKVPPMQLLDVNIKTFTKETTSWFAPDITFLEFSDSLNCHSEKVLKRYIIQHPEEIEREYVKNVTTFFYAYVKPFDKNIKLNLKIIKQ